MKIAITGANGYIGKKFVEIARARGCEILHLVRRKPESIEPWQHFDLCDETPVFFSSEVKLVIHLAFNQNVRNECDGLLEINSAKRLLIAAKSVGARFIFVSSQAARSDSPTLYGRIKWAIERLVLDAQGVVIRPGQVYGGNDQGLFGLLVRLVAGLPVLPAFFPAPLIQPVHVEDLSEALFQVAIQEDTFNKVYNIAESEPREFTSFLKYIAANRLQVRRLFIPVPIKLVNAMVVVLGRRMSQALGLSRLQSLFELPMIESAESLQLLGLSLRPLCAGMSKETSRTMLLQKEANVMLHYLLKEDPSQVLIQRYVAAIEQCRYGRPLRLPRFVKKYPVLLALLDDCKFLKSDSGAEFAWRLDAATLLAEATTEGAIHFMGINRPAGFFRNSVTLVYVVVMEIFWRMARIAAVPVFLRRAIRKSFP